MIIGGTLDKLKLISELKELHAKLVEVYKNIFDYKYKTSGKFKAFIDDEYKKNKIDTKKKQTWNNNFCHRASYTLLNRILFIRICEDKGSMLNPEDYVVGVPRDPYVGQKLSRKGLQKWTNLVTNYTLGELVKLAFLDMKGSYSNIALYKDDKYRTLNFTIKEISSKHLGGDKRIRKLVLQFEGVLNSIVERLDTDRFDFKNADGGILGDVYENFIDRETRKAIGQFYTPGFVIECILKNTVAEANVVENPFVSVADISCGSGHFLIMAYDMLREKFINNLELLRDKYADEIYTIKKQGETEELSGKDYWTEENIHYHLLKHCIYGADIDSFAVQLTTINLLLKDFGNLTDELNIVKCDSLIKWEKDYDWKNLQNQLKEEFEIIKTTQINMLGEEVVHEIKQRKENYELKYIDSTGLKKFRIITEESAEEIVNLCDFWNTKFDYVVGNPPYVGHKQLGMDHKEWLLNNYSHVFKDKSDLSFCFFGRILDILSEGGTAGIITSRYFMESPTGRNLRKYLQQNAKMKEIVDFYGAEIFKGVGVATAIYIFKKLNRDCESTKINKLIIDEYDFDDCCDLVDVLQADAFDSFSIDQEALREDRWVLVPDEYFKIYKKIINKTKYKLSDVVTCFQGIITGCDRAFVMTHKESKERGIETDLLKKWIKNSNVKDYVVTTSNLVLIYSDLIDSESEYPNSIGFIGRYRDRLENRRECRNGVRKWYELQWGRKSDLFEQPKIVFPYKARNNKFAVDFNNCYCSADVYSMVLKEKFEDIVSLEYLVGLLNSNIYEFYFKLFAKKLGKGMYDYYPNSILDLKIITDEIINKIEDNTGRIMELHLNIKNIGIDKFSGHDDIVKRFIELKIENARIKEKIYLLQKDNESIIGKYLGLNEGELKLISNSLNQRDINEVRMLLNREKFYKEYVIENKSLSQIAVENDTDEELVEIIWGDYIGEFLHAGMGCHNLELSGLFSVLVNSLQMALINSFILINEPVCTDTLKRIVQEQSPDLVRMINFLKIYNIKISSDDLLKQSLESSIYTWNTYRKTKKNNKINKIFVKYYDKNYYGLAEWPDETHKNYFLEATEKYTVTKPNEKRAKDIFELFKDLEIEDKWDYIEILEGKIKKAFK